MLNEENEFKLFMVKTITQMIGESINSYCNFLVESMAGLKPYQKICIQPLTQNTKKKVMEEETEAE